MYPYWDWDCFQGQMYPSPWSEHSRVGADGTDESDDATSMSGVCVGVFTLEGVRCPVGSIPILSKSGYCTFGCGSMWCLTPTGPKVVYKCLTCS